MIDVKFSADLRDVWQRLAQKHVGTWAHVTDIILAERSTSKASGYFSSWIDTTRSIAHMYNWRPNAD